MTVISNGINARFELGQKSKKDQQELVEAHQEKINMLTDECTQVCKAKNLKHIYLFNRPIIKYKLGENELEKIGYEKQAYFCKNLLISRPFIKVLNFYKV